MDVHDKLDQISALVEDARAMPMSASALVNRAELLGLLDDLRELLPAQLHDADVLLSDRAAVVDQGRAQAEQLVAQARAEHDRLVEETAVVVSARERADAVLSAAQSESQRLLTQADDYVDRKLGEFEIALDQLMAQVRRGRERLAERQAADGGRAGSGDGDTEGALGAGLSAP